MALERFGVTNDGVTTLCPSSLGLTLVDSDVVDIATELRMNHTLLIVDLSGTALTVEAAEALGRALGPGSLSILQMLKLNNCSLTADALKMLLVPIAQNSNSKVAAVELAHNRMHDDGAVVVAQFFATSSSIRTVDLTACKIGPAGATAIASALAVTKKLKTLVLASNKLKEEGTLALCEGIALNKSLVVLDISSNGINATAGARLARVLRINKTIESLLLSRNYLSDSTPSIVAALSERNVPSRILDLAVNVISDKLCSDISSVLESNKFSSTCLRFSGNPIGNSGLSAMFHALRGSNVQLLDIGECSLTSASGYVLGDLLRYCPMLTSIHIDGNNMGDESLRDFAKAAQVARNLTSIHLERCGMGPESSRLLAQSLRSNTRMRSFVLAENRGSDVVALLDALAQGHDLEYLDLSDLDLVDGEALVRAMLAVMTANPKLPHILLQRNPIARGMTGEAFTRRMVRQLTDADQPSDAGIVVPTTTANDVVELTFRPAWATVQAMDHRPFEDGADSDREDGWDLPLIPLPASLLDPLYPGYGKGRFSNQSLIGQLSNHVPYNIHHSRGPPPPFVWTGDRTAELTSPARRMAPPAYSLRRLESNMGRLPVTEDQLKRKFDELDVEGNGYLNRDMFKRIYLKFENFGAPPTEREFEEVAARYGATSPQLSFDHFCIFMLRLAQR